MTKLLWLRFASACLMIALFIPTLQQTSASADSSPQWHPSNFTVLGIAGALWWNYDSNTTAYDPNTDYPDAVLHPDWPLTQFFWHNANYYSVFAALCSNAQFADYCQGGGSHQLRAQDSGSSWMWARNYDGGEKNGNPCNGWDIHYVAYQGSHINNTAFFNPSWGFWMPTSVHYDYNDGNGCSGGTAFGYSDQAERNLENAERNAGLSPDQAGQNWYNYEAYRVEIWNYFDHAELHVWESVNNTVPVCVQC